MCTTERRPRPRYGISRRTEAILGVALLASSALAFVPKASSPPRVLLGVAGLYGGINFAATSLLIVAAVYQVMMPLPRPSF